MQENSGSSERAAEGVFHRLWATEGTRILLVVLGAVLSMMWNDFKDDVAKMSTAQNEQNRVTSQIQSDVRNINTRLDEGVVKQVAQHQESLRRLEERVIVLERRAKLP